MEAYHVTVKKNVGAIRRFGLIPRDTAKYNYPTRGGEKAVYAFTDKSEADRYLTAAAGWLCMEASALAMLKIDLEGLEVHPDPSFRTLVSSVKTFERVPPSKILGHAEASS